MYILGGGLTGLICACLNTEYIIYDKNVIKPNHHAVLRFNTDALSNALNIPFEKVKVLKGIWYKDRCQIPSPHMNNMYSLKTTEKILNRSIMDINTETRFIPPSNLHNQIYDRCHKRIMQGHITGIDIDNIILDGGDKLFRRDMPVISTMPMEVLSWITNMPIRDYFPTAPIYVYRFELHDCNAHCTMYYPDHSIAPYRASITGSTLIIECMWEMENKDDLKVVLDSMALSKEYIKAMDIEPIIQPLGKISPIGQLKRKNFILMQTLQNNIYSLGRYATWRPKLMLDDLPEDISIINKVILDRYDLLMHQQGDK